MSKNQKILDRVLEAFNQDQNPRTVRLMLGGWLSAKLNISRHIMALHGATFIGKE